MSRNHQGYSQANQSLLEEEEENRSSGGRSGSEDELEAGRGRHTVHPQSNTSYAPSKPGGRRLVSWDAGASEMNVMRPNIHKEDKLYDDSSDDEVPPQSFMIEATSGKPSSSKGKHKAEGSSSGGRSRTLQSTPGRKFPPSKTPSLSTPLRPSEVDLEDPQSSRMGFADTLPQYNQRQTKPLRGLDDYEKALWNWVNVYNLDAFLQEVYYYYEGKGMYSIALSRGLNLL